MYKFDDNIDDNDDGDTDDGENENVGQLGAFAFGVTAETARYRYVQTAGNAYYDGETLAVAKDGTHYSGDIAIRVRFATERVDGLITNLTSTDGEPWTYLYGDVESIVLPTADMASSGIWSVTAPTDTNGLPQDADDASITYALRAGSPGPQTMNSTFNGRLLGTGDNAGYQTVGTWSLGDDPSASTYIAGGFGAERISDEPDVRPDPGDGIDATLMSNSETGGGLTSLADGMLKITVAKYGWERASNLGANDSTYAWGRLAVDLNDDGDTEDNLSEAGDSSADPPYKSLGDLTLDGDTEDSIAESDAATRTYSISLSTVLGKEGGEGTYNGGNYVTMARQMIQAERSRLAVLIDSDQLAGEQANIWKKIQEILLVYVFKADTARSGTEGQGGFAGRLPVQVSGNYDKSSALDRIDRILDALSSSSNLEEALDPDEDGLFVEDDNNPFVSWKSAIWSERDSQVKYWVGTTDYTRFGTWRVRRSRNAQRGGGWQNAEKETFAYSPLPKSVVADAKSPNYPSGSTATYQGKTVAFVANAGYEGAVDVTVTWGVGSDGSPLTDGVGGRLYMVLSNLQNVDGDDLTHGSGSRAVRDIVFPYVAFTTGEDNILNFKFAAANEDGRRVAINYTDRNVTASSITTANVSGTFVGTSADGPLGVMGLYDITGFTVGAKNVTIDGAFGADLP